MFKFSKFISHALITILQLSLVTPQAYPDALASPSPSSSPADVSNWQDTCNHVTSAEDMLKTYTNNTCLASASCKQQAMSIIQNNFGQIAPICKAAQLTGKTKWMEITSVSVYSAAAAVCIMACATKFLGSDASQICTGASTGATVVDLGMTIALTVEKKKFDEWYNNKDGKTYKGLEFGGTAGGALASGVSLYSNAKDMKLPVGDIKIKGAVKDGNGKTTQKGKAGSCFAAALLAGAAAAKGFAIPQDKKVEDAIKQQIVALGSSMMTSLTAAEQNSSGGATNSFLGNGGASNATATTSSTTNPLAGASNDLLNGTNPQVNAAIAGTPGMGDFLKRLGPDGASKAALDKLGFNPGAFAAKINSGMSASAAMGEMMPTLPKDALKEIKEIEDLAKNGQVAMSGVTGTSYVASKAAPANTSESSGMKELDFGNEEAKTENLTPTLDFDGRKPAAAVTDTEDIYHANYHGTIFDIVSQRITKAQSLEE